MRNLEGLKKGHGWNRGLSISGMSGKKQSKLFMEKLSYRNLNDNPSKREEIKEKMRLAKIGKFGSLSNHWKGGKPNLKSRWKNCKAYKDWRISVLKRDGFSCIQCGSREQLEADHLHPISTHPFEAYLIENGQTLCRPCHIKTPTYGGRALSFVCKSLFLVLFLSSISQAYSLIFNPFTNKLDYVGISTDSLATSAILNQSTLQAGATFYVSSGTVVNALNLYGDFKINNAGTDYVSYSTTTAKLRLINGATSLSTSLPLLLWNNNNIVGRFTGIGFAVGSSSSPLAYWYLDNQNNRFNMADGSGNVACYFDTLTFNLVCNYGITASTGTFGNASSTSFGNNPYVTINSSGSSEGLLVQGYGKPSGGYQNQLGLVTIISTTTGTPGSGVPQPLLVLVDSTTDPQLGTGLMEIWSNNSAHNDPIFWMHTNSPNSGPDMRVDSQAFNFEFVNLSTDNAHGMGKFEIAMANKGVDFQVNSRAYDNSTFENIAYWQALQKDKDLGPGLYIQPQNLTNDSGVMSSSSTSGIDFYTLNSHLVGLTGPKNVASGSWRFGLPSTPNNQGQVLYQSTNSDGTKFGDRQWEFTTGGATNFPLTSQGTGAPQWSTTLSSISVVGATSAVYELQVSSSATGFHVAVSTSGHFITAGGAPTISSCGSTPNGSVVGNDNEGIITVGGGSVTSCTLTFFSTWGATPTCVITDNSTAITGDISAISATAFTTSFSLSLGGGTIYYRCGCSGSLCR